MKSIFQIDPNLDIPIYQQLVDKIRAGTKMGTLVPGQQLPTVQELASELSIARGTIKRAYDELDALCNDAFRKLGFNADEAENISDVLLMSDRIGMESHGMQRMYRYDKSIQKGMIKVASKGNVVFGTLYLL